MHDDSDAIELELAQLFEQTEELFQKSCLASAVRIAKEATRLASGHQRILPCLNGLFDQMRFSHGLLEPHQAREAAVELVMLVEDEEQARRIQPDLDEGEYHSVVAWMSSCVYDNLAEATGAISGYNSRGLHDCINEGIQICRQTGKLDCIRCFREYAADVYLAADDMDMVRHQCQVLLTDDPLETQKDRRWSAHFKLGWVDLLEGRFDAALKHYEQSHALSQGEDVYLPHRAGLVSAIELDSLRLLMGGPRLDWNAMSQQKLTPPAKGEWPKLELEWDKLQALEQIVSGNHAEAIEQLTHWDRRLNQQKCLKEWFEVRLRLIAAYLLADKRKRAEALAKGLEASAFDAQDYLTLRRLKTLLSTAAVSAIPLLNDDASAADRLPGSMPDSVTNGDPAAENGAAKQDTAEEDEEEATTPLAETLVGYMQEIISSDGSDESAAAILGQILSHPPAQVEDANDAAYLVHLAQYVTRGADEAAQVWPWSLGLMQKFSEDAGMINVVAALGQYFLTADPEEFADRIDPQQLENWFRLSLTLDAQHPQNHARAGAFFLEQGNVGEAERNFARAFRLDRSDAGAAQNLAQIYRDTERPRDALAVYDLCLREGSEDPHIAWEAALTAIAIEQYAAGLTYLDRFADLSDDHLWLHYYRALALLQTGQTEAALTEVEQEFSQDPPGTFHLHVLKALALNQLGQTDAAEAELTLVLDRRWSDIDYLSFTGLVKLTAMLWEGLESWNAEHPLIQQLELRLLRTGLMPDSYFDLRRQSAPESEEVRFFRVQLEQPLDEGWAESEGCLHGQQGWDHYLIEWGVLAETDGEAVVRVLEYQRRCEHAEAEVAEILVNEDIYTDRTGVVWQGPRHCDADIDALSDDDDDEDEE